MLSFLLPIALRVFMMFLDGRDKDDETRKQFLQFVSALGNDMTAPTKIRKLAQSQKERLLRGEFDGKKTA